MFVPGLMAGEVQASVQILVTSEACSRAVLQCVHMFHTCSGWPQSSQIVLAVPCAGKSSPAIKIVFHRIFLEHIIQPKFQHLEIYFCLQATTL